MDAGTNADEGHEASQQGPIEPRQCGRLGVEPAQHGRPQIARGFSLVDGRQRLLQQLLDAALHRVHSWRDPLLLQIFPQ